MSIANSNPNQKHPNQYPDQVFDLGKLGLAIHLPQVGEGDFVDAEEGPSVAEKINPDTTDVFQDGELVVEDASLPRVEVSVPAVNPKVEQADEEIAKVVEEVVPAVVAEENLKMVADEAAGESPIPVAEQPATPDASNQQAAIIEMPATAKPRGGKNRREEFLEIGEDATTGQANELEEAFMASE